MMAFHCLLLLLAAVVTISELVTHDDLYFFAIANNNLAMTLYYDGIHDSKIDYKNFCICPLSIMTGWGIMLYGAGGETQKELYNILGYEDAYLPLKKIVPTYDHYFKYYLPENDPNLSNYTLLCADEVMISNEFPIKPKFQKKAQNIYQATIKNVDFSQTDEVLKGINDFVDQHTHGNIKHLTEDLSDTTHASLQDAVYFKGNWETPFFQCLTLPEPFYSHTETKNVQFMQVIHSFPYYEKSFFQAVFLPYVGGNIGLLVILPKEEFSLSDLEEDISQFEITDILFNLKPETTLVKLPKFKIEYFEDYVQDFYDHGLRTAIGENSNYTGITDAKGLHIISSPNKAVIEVDESSPEDGGAYDPTVVASSTVVANRPFMFVVVDRRFNLFFYIGRVYEV